MKTLKKLFIFLFLLIGVLEVRSNTLAIDTVILNRTHVNLCEADKDTVNVVNYIAFKVFLWQIALVGGTTWIDASTFDHDLFPNDTLSFLIIPGNTSLNNHKVRCLASKTTSLINGIYSAEVPITVRNPITGQGTISGPYTCCFGQQTLFYTVAGYTNATSYDWSLPSWASIILSNDLGDSIGIAGFAPAIGGDTVISVIPQNITCGPGPGYSYDLKVIGQITGPGSITGPDYLCKGNGTIYSAGDYLNATRYHWIVPSWITISSASPDSMTITLVANLNASGSISVIPINPCGSGVMASKMISVYNELTPGVIGPDTAICYNTYPGILGFSILPTGSDGNYQYQWQDSTATTAWTNISAATGTTYSPGKLETDHYYRVKITSNACSTSEFTDMIRVRVYLRFEPGVIGDDQKTCVNDQPEILHLNNPPYGGTGIYDYQWISSTNQTSWVNVGNEIDSSYQPPSLEQGIYYYRLIVSTTSGCGTDTTNTVRILVNPQPLTASILGSTDVCRNQFDSEYNADPVRPGYTYSWSLQQNLGSFEAGQYTSRTYIHWGNTSGFETLVLYQTIDSSHCVGSINIQVNILSDIAPSRTMIMRKPNSNMLICADSSDNLKYQWGFIPKNTQVPELIQGAIERYVILPHTFDTIAYIYFVDTYYENPGSVSCTTRSYMNQYSLPIGVDDLIDAEYFPVVFPNPSSGVVNILLPDSYTKTDIQVHLFDLAGRLHVNATYSPSSLICLALPPSLQQGLYILQLFSATNPVFSTRLTIIK